MKTAPLSRRDRLRQILADLRMPGALEALTAPEAIGQLLSAQIQLRNHRRLQAAMRSSRLPGVKQLRDFDFTFQPSLRREQIESLHELGFVERHENVILLGPPRQQLPHAPAHGPVARPTGRDGSGAGRVRR